MTFAERAILMKKIIEDLKKDKLRMEAGTFDNGWKYKISIPLKDYKKGAGENWILKTILENSWIWEVMQLEFG